MAAVKKPRASANNDYYVKDIGLAFIERPETAPDTACLANLKPKFVLPPG